MRILMVHNQYGKRSGEEHAFDTIARTLESHGHEIHRFLKQSSDIAHTFPGKVRAFFAGIHSPASRAEMRRELAAAKYEIVQVQNLYPLLSPSILRPCRELHLPVVMRCPNYRLFCPTGLHLYRGQVCEKCLHGSEISCVLQNCTGSMAKSVGYAARNAAARLTGSIRDNVSVFVVLSEFQRRRFIDAGVPDERIAIVPNFEPEAELEEPGPFEERDTIGLVGRLSPEKGVMDFLAAARAFPDRRFAIAGDTDGMPEAVAAAPPNVHFEGFVSGAGLTAFYRRLRMLVFPSLCFEGFPNVITRAMFGAIPVVCSRIGSMGEIVEDGVSGIHFSPGCVEEIVDGIRKLEDDDLRRRLGEGGRARARRLYSREAAYTGWMRVYEQARAIEPTLR